MPERKPEKTKNSLINLIIQKQNTRHLLGWNYCAGTSNYKEAVYWLAELAALAQLIILDWQEEYYYSTCAMIYLIKHCLLSLDYGYSILRGESTAVDFLTNANNIQFWVASGSAGLPLLQPPQPLRRRQDLPPEGADRQRDQDLHAQAPGDRL